MAKLNTMSKKALVSRVLGHWKKQEPQKAVPELEALLEKEPDSVQYRTELAKCLFLGGKVQESIKLLQAGVKKTPKEAQYYLLAAAFASTASKEKQALELLDSAPASVKKASEFLYLRGSLHLQTGDAKQALKDAAAAVEAADKPDDATLGLWLRAEMAVHGEDSAEAVRIAKQMTAQTTGDFMAVAVLSRDDIKHGRAEHVVSTFTRQPDELRTHPVVLAITAAAQSALKRKAEADALKRQAAAGIPDFFATAEKLEHFINSVKGD